MDFGEAIRAMKAGSRVCRSGWNGKGMYIAIQGGSCINSNQARGGVAMALAMEGKPEIVILPHIDMRSAQGEVVVGWLASQTDMLAEDWINLDVKVEAYLEPKETMALAFGGHMLPAWKCHKVVRASKILEIDYATCEMKLDNGYGTTVEADYINKHKPQVGGYFVVYNAGTSREYFSYSPGDIFDEGYTRL